MEKDFKKNRQFWKLCISTALFFTSFNMLIPELPNYLTSLGGAEYKGLIISLFTITAMLSRPFSGKLTDTIGRIPVMVFGAGVAMVASLLYPLLTSVTGFLFLRFVHGMSTGFKPTATSAYAADVISPAKRGEAMGILGIFTSTGMAVGPMLGPFITSLFSYDILFYVSAAFAFLSVAVILGMNETLPQRKRVSPSLLKIKITDFYEPRALPAAITFLLTVYSFGVILTIVPDFSEYLHVPNRGYFYSIFVVTSIGIRLFAGKVSDKHGRVAVLILASFLIGMSQVALAYSATPNMFYISAALFGIAAGMNGPTLFAWNIDLSIDKFRGRAMATLYIALEIGIGLGAYFSALIFSNKVENFTASILSGAVLAFMATAYLVYLKIVRRDLR